MCLASIGWFCNYFSYRNIFWILKKALFFLVVVLGVILVCQSCGWVTLNCLLCISCKLLPDTCSCGCVILRELVTLQQPWSRLSPSPAQIIWWVIIQNECFKNSPSLPLYSLDHMRQIFRELEPGGFQNRTLAIPPNTSQVLVSLVHSCWAE